VTQRIVIVTLLVACAAASPAASSPAAFASELAVIAGDGKLSPGSAPEEQPFAAEAWEPSRPPLASPLALQTAEPEDQVGSGRLGPKKPRERSMEGNRTGGLGAVMGGARARILLQSLTVPGWGQATAGRRTAASIFALAETGVWASFTAFRIQQTLRRHSYERTAALFAGIDLEGRDEGTGASSASIRAARSTTGT
jgi:hypothetical protein